MSNRQFEKEVRNLEKRWEHMRMKYQRSLKELQRLEEEKVKKDPSPKNKRKLEEIDRELAQLEADDKKLKGPENDAADTGADKGGAEKDPAKKEAAEKEAAEKEAAEKEAAEKEAAEKEAAEKEAAEKEAAEKEAAEKDKPGKKKEKGILEKAQEGIKAILIRRKPEDEKCLADMKDELKSAMADLIAKRVAYIDPNDPRDNIIRGDKKTSSTISRQQLPQTFPTLILRRLLLLFSVFWRQYST